MPGAKNKDRETMTVPELQQLVQRAEKGDASAVPTLRRVLDANPQIWREFGDLSQHAQMALVSLAAGSNLHLRECLARKVIDMQQELAGPSPSPLVRLLAERAAACWVQVAYFDALQAQAQGMSLRQASQLRQQQDSAQRRYLGALRMLGTVQRLLPPVCPGKPEKDRTVPDHPRFSGNLCRPDALTDGVGVLN